MTASVQIVGSYLSPYVRKVLVFLELKGVRYEIDPIVPFMGDDRFAGLSPLRRIPVLIDDRVTLTDSSVICQYLEDRYPAPPLYPADIADRARARWLEEFADTRLADLLIWGLFNETMIGPAVWGRTPDLARIAQIRDVELPRELDYLERELPSSGFIFGTLDVYRSGARRGLLHAPPLVRDHRGAHAHPAATRGPGGGRSAADADDVCERPAACRCAARRLIRQRQRAEATGIARSHP